MMPLSRLTLANFTVFEKAAFPLSPGINVLVGENGTGKTHVLKALYAVTRTLPKSGLPSWRSPTGFGEVFGYRSVDGNHLARRFNDGDSATVTLEDESGSLSLSVRDAVLSWSGALERAPRPVFIPSREILSVYRGFAAAIRNGELAFDATYLDLAESLETVPRRGEALAKQQPLIDSVEAALGGREDEVDGEFFVTLGQERFEAQLVAEGLRKVAQVARLLRNGRIAPGTLLLWDEPEANLNPVLLRRVTDLLLLLARAGVQVVLATHDYLLSQTLSLYAEHPKADTPPLRFFGLAKDEEGAPVEVHWSETIAGIEDNPILREHARQYDLEVAAYAGEA